MRGCLQIVFIVREILRIFLFFLLILSICVRRNAEQPISKQAKYRAFLLMQIAQKLHESTPGILQEGYPEFIKLPCSNKKSGSKASV